MIGTDFSAPDSLSLVIRLSPFLLVWRGRGHLSQRAFILCFLRRGEDRVIFWLLLLKKSHSAEDLMLKILMFWECVLDPISCNHILRIRDS